MHYVHCAVLLQEIVRSSIHPSVTLIYRNRIEGLLKRLKRGGYLKEYISFAKLSI